MWKNVPCLYWSVHSSCRDWMGLLKSIVVSAGWFVCCQVCAGVRMLWMQGGAVWGAGVPQSSGTLSCGSSTGAAGQGQHFALVLWGFTSESPWGAALPWSSPHPSSLGLSGRLSSFLPVSFKIPKRTIPSPGCSTWTCPSLLAELGYPQQQQNKSQSAAGEMQTVILHFSWASCTPELGAVLGTVPVPPLQLCQLCQHSLFPPLGINAELDTSWPVTDVHGPLHSGRISGYFPNVN